jgi:hypothetical protein
MSELSVCEAKPAVPVQAPERVKLGRILHLDRTLSRSPCAWWEAHLIVHGFFGLLVSLCAVGVYDEPENAVLAYMLVVFGLTWLGTTLLMELLIRQNAVFELQLLPSGIRLTNLDGTVELIEPEIVGGKWSRWWQLIKLREGKQEVMIPLSRFRHNHERAAIIEHCSQFLSPKQQAEFGPEWTRAFYELITPAKANLRRLLLVMVPVVGLGIVGVVAITEGVLWAYPESGEGVRRAYLLMPIWFGLLFSPLAWECYAERRGREKDSAKLRP